MKKILMTTAVAATLLTTSIGVYAASNTDINTSVKPQIENKVATSDIAQDPSNSKGRIEYTKTATLRADGSEGMIFEAWNNPKTFDSRTDNIMKRDGKVESYTSTYSKDGGRSIVSLQRDEKGTAINGSITPVNQEGADYNNSLFSKYNSFAAVRAQYTSKEWNSDGTIKTQDGKTLKKVSKSYRTVAVKPKANMSKQDIKNLKQVTMKEVAYLDETTGLPTKIELYQENDGNMNLVDTRVYEFKYLDTVGNLFDTSGVNLKQLPQFNYDKNAKG